MTPEFCFKLGLLLGRVDEMFVRWPETEIDQGDVDSLLGLVKDVKTKFFEMQKKEAGSEK